MAPRKDEAGYFVVINAEGAEIEESRRHVGPGVDLERDQRILDALRAAMGAGCDVVFKPDGGVSPL